MQEFKFFQKEILSAINTNEGRKLLNIQDNNQIVKVSPNSYHLLKGFDNGNLVLQATFFTSNRVAEKFLPLFSPSRFYRYAYLTDPFTANTGEGRIDRGNDAAWADARGAASGNSTAATINVYASTGFYIIRSFFPIDTSSIGSGSTIVAGGNTFKVYRDDSIGSGFFNDNSTRVELVQTTQASNTSLATSDYSLITFTSGGNFTYASTSNNAYSTITLNTTADAWISTTAHTKLALIAGRDFDNSQPTGTNQIYFQARGGANPPTLTVTYTRPDGGFIYMSV